MKKSLVILVLFFCFVLRSGAQLICFEYPADTFSRPGDPWQITAADFNEDGYDDLAIGLYDEHYVSIMLNDGKGNFENFSTLNNFNEMPGICILAIHINNDDHFDLVVTGHSFNIFIFMGNGDGTFYQSSAPYLGSWTREAVAGYYNEDNFIDLALIHNDNSSYSIMLGKYTGTFEELYNNWTFGNTPMKIAQGDFNEDGNADLVICNWGTPIGEETSLVLFTGNGTGHFLPHVVSEENYPESAAIGDFNMDGHSDIIFKRLGWWLFKLWGNGDGTFREPEVMEIDAGPFCKMLHTVDIDSDSIPDLAAACDYFNMFINDGTGNFDDTMDIASSNDTKRVAELAIGKFNDDEKPDIVTANDGFSGSHYGSLTLYLNCLPVSIHEKPAMDEEIVIYPNPGTGIVSISINFEMAELELSRIYNFNGQIVDAGSYRLAGRILDLSSFNPGIYFVHFKHNNKSVYKKVILTQ